MEKTKKQELINKAIKLYESGKSVQEISETVNAGTITIYKWLKLGGVKMRPKGKPLGVKNKKNNMLEILKSIDKKIDEINNALAIPAGYKEVKF